VFVFVLKCNYGQRLRRYGNYLNVDYLY